MKPPQTTTHEEHNYIEANIAQDISEVDSFTVERYQQFYKLFPCDALRVLDVGCNTGRGGKALRDVDSHLEIFGLDCVQARLDRLPPGVYKGYVCSYTSDINAPDNSYDVVVAGELIEHLLPADVESTLREFYRVLRPQGRMLLTTPNPQYIKLKLTGGSVLGGAHVSEHYHRELRRRVERLGFRSIKVRGTGKVSRYLGQHFPLLFLYGSYMLSAEK